MGERWVGGAPFSSKSEGKKSLLSASELRRVQRVKVEKGEKVFYLGDWSKGKGKIATTTRVKRWLSAREFRQGTIPKGEKKIVGSSAGGERGGRQVKGEGHGGK